MKCTLRVFVCAVVVIAAGLASALGASQVVVVPKEYPRALRNPLMGFRAGTDGKHPWSTLAKTYIKWSDLENSESDTIGRIRECCDRLWRGVEQRNVKVIPRVYLRFKEENEKCWPADMQPDDFSSPQFQRRVVRLVGRLGKAWDNDPRVGYVEMGIIGKWGEQHTPSVSAPMQKLLGDAFSKAFPNKLVMVRHPWDFAGYTFGIHWDSWAHVQQMATHGAGIAKLGERWMRAPMGGEADYDWGNHAIQPGENPTDTVKDPGHRKYFINSIHWLHCNHVGGVSDYDQADPEAARGAEEIQRALGYRWVVDEVRYPASVAPGKTFLVSFTVRNTGSSPMYYRWPVELSLLDRQSRAVRWKAVFSRADVRSWLPGEKWDEGLQQYLLRPRKNVVRELFTLPENFAPGQYILALAVLDPGGMLPSARFAMVNYFKGGRHPIGLVGVGTAIDKPQLDKAGFDEPGEDRSLGYRR